MVTESTLVSADTSSASEGEDSDDEEEEENKEVLKAPKKLIEDEGRAIGHVGFNVWKLYLGLSGGVLFWTVFVFAFVGTKLADVAQSFWVNIWARSCTCLFSSCRALSLIADLFSRFQMPQLKMGEFHTPSSTTLLCTRGFLSSPSL